MTGQADADALAQQSLVEACALWSLDVMPSEAIVDAATNALVAGLDSQSLRVLAGTVPAAAAIEVPELLPQAMRELGLPFFARSGTAGQLPAAQALAREFTGAVSARAPVARMHRVFGHGAHALIEPLVALDDVYDTLEYTDEDEADVDRQVLEAAEHLLSARRGLNEAAAGTIFEIRPCCCRGGLTACRTSPPAGTADRGMLMPVRGSRRGRLPSRRPATSRTGCGC